MDRWVRFTHAPDQQGNQSRVDNTRTTTPTTKERQYHMKVCTKYNPQFSNDRPDEVNIQSTNAREQKQINESTKPRQKVAHPPLLQIALGIREREYRSKKLGWLWIMWWLREQRFERFEPLHDFTNDLETESSWSAHTTA